MNEEIISNRIDKDGFERVFQLHGKNITYAALTELLQLMVITPSEFRAALGFPNAEVK